MKKRKFAVFDIDGTVFRSSLLIELVEELISQGTFSSGVRRKYERAQEKWLNRNGSYYDYIGAVVDAFAENIRGVGEEELKRAVNHVVEVHRYRVYRYTRNLVKKLKKKGYFLLAISHSPKYILDEFCLQMGFDKVYGRLLELDKKGKFTGRTYFTELIEDKAKILKRAVEKENLDIKGSMGVGDTESDIKFLELVEKPICFNPNKKLYTVAKKKGWPIIVERKNVIYGI